jgi:hypothetical protein
MWEDKPNNEVASPVQLRRYTHGGRHIFSCNIVYMTKQTTDVSRSVCKEKHKVTTSLDPPNPVRTIKHFTAKQPWDWPKSKLKEDNVGIDCEECREFALSILADPIQSQ